jgi:hypothetical protein
VANIINRKVVIQVGLIRKVEKTGKVTANAVIVRRGTCVRKFQCEGCPVITRGLHCPIRKS